jgi:hypothetical protein
MSIIPYSTGNIPTYRFYLTYSTITYEVFPLKFLETTLTDEVETGQIFYRRKFSGELLFGTNSKVLDVSGVEQNRQDDFTLLWLIEGIDPCTRLDLTITKTVSGVIDTYWEGYFSTSDGKFDIDKCTFIVTPFLDDVYKTILDKADQEFNLLNIPGHISTTAYIMGLYNTVITNNWLLMVVAQYILNVILPTATISSHFFEDATNYVQDPLGTGVNYLRYTTIASKAEVVATTYDPTISCMISWNSFMDILRDMFQVYWNYDPVTNVVNIEHISWFTKAAGLDLRTQTSCVAMNKYDYNKPDMPKYEKFFFVEADDPNFVGTPIYYDSPCVNQDSSSNVVETKVNVTTDIEYVINNPDAIADDGFIILANYFDGADYYVRSGMGDFYNSFKLNMHLSWANLENCYFRHNRVLLEGYMNQDPNDVTPTLTTFWNARETKIQNLNAILCTDYDPDDSITTELGETYFAREKATVKRGSLKPSGEINFDLLYGVPDNTNTGVIEYKAIYVHQEASCLGFSFTLSEISAVDIDITFHVKVYDSIGGLDCEADETLTITAGLMSVALNTVNCPPPIPAGGCVTVTMPTKDDSGIWYIFYDDDSTCEC